MRALSKYAVVLVSLLTLSGVANAVITIPSDGSDGALTPVANMTIDLSNAPTAAWNTPGTGQGVYDPDLWVIVFKYTTVDIPPGVTVSFTNHPSRAPVVWLVQGDVAIEGTVSVNGGLGHNYNVPKFFSEPGPGGFRGGFSSGAASASGPGMGPGGGGAKTGGRSGNGGGYATAGGIGEGSGLAGQTYGNPGVFPLIGGSGGSGANNGTAATGGGAGAGAILIATPGTFTLEGTLRANGGHTGGGAGGLRGGGGGAGGGIRVIAETIQGDGALQALAGSGGVPCCGQRNGGSGGLGRIRVETNTNTLTDPGNPPYSQGIPGDTPRLFPDTTDSVIRTVMVGTEAIPADPRSEIAFPGTDVSLTDGTGTTLTIETENVPTNATVEVRVAPRIGLEVIVNATHSSGDESFSTWTANLDIPGGFSSVQVRAILP